MKLSEMIAAIGDEKICMQQLAPAITNVATARGPVKGISAVTFLTTHMSPRDAIVPGDEIGLVLWIKREDLPESMR